MKKFDNLETTLVSKWFGNEIDNIISDNEGKSLIELESLVCEKIENRIKEDVSLLTEGYVSEIVGNSFDKIDYAELVKYYKG